MNSLRQPFAIGLSALLLGTAASVPAYAQPVSSDPVSGGPAAASVDEGEIIVTARKISENLQTVPIAISSFSGDTLEKQSVRSIGDMQHQLPNVQFQQSTADPQGLTIAMRGQRQNDTPPTVDPSVGIYIDSVYHPRTIGLKGALIDIERVEVLRGPQGTLYGRNTTGGAFSIYTKDPRDTFEGYVSGEYGNYDHRSISGMINVPLGPNVAARIVGQRTKRDGFGEDLVGQDLNKEDSHYIRGKLRAEFGDIVAILSASHQKNSTGSGNYGVALAPPEATGSVIGGSGTFEIIQELGLPSTPEGIAEAISIYEDIAARDPYHMAGTFPSKSHFTGKSAHLDLSIPLSDDINIRSITSYEHMKRSTSDDHDATPFHILELQFTNRFNRYISQELQLLGGNDTFNWVIGAYAGDEKGHYREIADVLVALTGGSQQISDAAVRNRTIAGFAQGNWEFIEDWRLTLGGRYSSDKRELLSNNTFGPAGNVVCTVPAPGVLVTGVVGDPDNGPSLCPRKFSATFSKPSWLISVDHKFNEDLFGYAKIARGFRTGGLNFRGANFAASFAPFGPETVTEYEIGVKWDAVPHVFRINIAAFHDEYKGAQRSIAIAGPNGAPIGLTTNAASGKIDGAEAEMRLTPVPKLVMTGTLGYLNARYGKFVDISGDRSDETFGVPKWTASGSVSYEIPTGIGPLSPQVDFHWQSKTIIDPTVQITLPSVTQTNYAIVNVRLSLDVDSFDATIAVWGKNVTDKVYLTNASNLESSIGHNQLIFGEPRTYGVTVTKRF